MPMPASAPISICIIMVPVPGSKYAYASEIKNPLKSNANVNNGNVIPVNFFTSNKICLIKDYLNYKI